jgi:excisionase family DNA binding protein
VNPAGLSALRRRIADDPDLMLTPGEVAALFRVDPKTVARWAAAGRLPSVKTPGGHHRFHARHVLPLLHPEAT